MQCIQIIHLPTSLSNVKNNISLYKQIKLKKNPKERVLVVKLFKSSMFSALFVRRM